MPDDLDGSFFNLQSLKKQVVTLEQATVQTVCFNTVYLDGVLKDLIINAAGLITDWERSVKALCVSSRESWAHRLLDRPSSYWQSCGMQGKVICTPVL